MLGRAALQLGNASLLSSLLDPCGSLVCCPASAGSLCCPMARPPLGELPHAVLVREGVCCKRFSLHSQQGSCVMAPAI